MTNKLAYICNAFYYFIYSCFATQIVKYISFNQHIKPAELKLSVIHGTVIVYLFEIFILKKVVIPLIYETHRC